MPAGRHWADCNRAVALSFELSGDWMQSFETKIPDQLASGIRVLIYAGDQDYICNWLGNQAWVRALPWAHAGEFNTAAVKNWTVGNEAAGTVQSAYNLTFLRVFGAGHMVPLDQPMASLLMLDAFLKGEL